MTDKESMSRSEHWIFYLKLTKELKEDYLLLDTEFKKTGKSLVPVNLTTLVDSVRRGQEANLIIVIKSKSELRFFQRRVQKIFKFLMRSERVNVFIASSFYSVNDPALMRKNFYHYVRLPVRVEKFCNMVNDELINVETNKEYWPGGNRGQTRLAG